ncbi:hypothetical protein RHSIM_Rhsim02G0021700 [Rhododendron simsii]|uniref:Pre-rRNA-processing protein TSR2 n=1 Tax=Rhododendron simsii TaxID=118357 RepID=A0A834HC98_RHOSS|nr:hypothetical protein RHSIM_Rhsim02G0021700 [Rhododendron simsii]
MESSVKPKADSLLLEGIAMVLSRWNMLQMAIQNQWGGRDSLLKSKQLASDILSWFSQSKEQPYVGDWRICCIKPCYFLSTQTMKMAALRKYVFFKCSQNHLIKIISKSSTSASSEE